jgi:hypothetical protein
LVDGDENPSDLGIPGRKWWLILNKPQLNSQQKAADFIKSGLAVNADIINNILSIYNLHVTDEALKDLVSIPKISFDSLSKDLIKDPYFKDRLGVANRPVAGVYIFTHKESGAKYVGSSVQLATRLERHLKSTYKVSGKF